MPQPDHIATVATRAWAARVLNANNTIGGACYALRNGRLRGTSGGSDADQNGGKCEIAGHVVLLDAMDEFDHAASRAVASMGQRLLRKG